MVKSQIGPYGNVKTALHPRNLLTIIDYLEKRLQNPNFAVPPPSPDELLRNLTF